MATYFAPAIKQFTKEVKAELGFVVSEVAKTTFKVLLTHSPHPGGSSNPWRNDISPYSKGAYVMSHRIGINAPSSEPCIILGDDVVFPNAKAIAESNGNAKLSGNTALIEKVVIHNKNPHAGAVEHGEWDWEFATAPAYYTYARTGQQMGKALDSQVRIAAAKYKGKK